MSDLIEVLFKGNRKEFFRWEDVVPPPSPKTHVIVEGDRGEDMGQVHTIGDLAEKRFAGVAHGAAVGEATRRVIRTASRDEVKRAQALLDENEATRRAAMTHVRELGLQMKITDADWQWDHRKLTLYFTAEKRVDFRTLVRDLAAQFKARIELKQIGVRDEAKRLDGVGRCGRQYCSASWLPDLRPVNLGVAKDQKLSLNPTQISGACGRLMCCLRYEHEFYAASRKRFPKEGKILVTSKGEEKVMSNDIFHDRVTLRAVDGESRILTLAELRAETTSWVPNVTDDAGAADASLDSGDEGMLVHDDAPRRGERTRVPPQTERSLKVLQPVPAPVLTPAVAASRIEEQLLAERKAAEQRTAEQRLAEQRLAEQLHAEQKAAELKAAELPTAEQLNAAPRVTELKGTELKDTELKGTELKGAELNAAERRATEMRSADPRAAEPPSAGTGGSRADDGGDADEGDDDEDGDGGADASAESGDAPKRRRRRGRRGGRRGRGNRPPSSGDAAPQ
jgi:cell fate regulator YaaT (PSP1 superfamily)